MPGRDERPTAVGGMVPVPEPGDPSLAAEVIAASDAHDARPLDVVEAEVFRRSGGGSEAPADDVKGPAQR